MYQSISKYILLILILTLSFNINAQDDTITQNYTTTEDTITTETKDDLELLKQQLSSHRISLQSIFKQKDSEKNIDEICRETSTLEKSIIDFINFNKKISYSDQEKELNNADSELLLARLVYIKTKTWCMEEKLQLIVEVLLNSSKNSSSINKSIVNTVAITESVINCIDRTKCYDRLKYRYNHELVISQWNYTSKKLSNIDKDVILDKEFKKQYQIMLNDLNNMIGVLSTFDTQE